MKTHIIYLDDVENLVIAKYFIEKKLIENNVISEKLSIPDFVNKVINMANTMAIFNEDDNSEIVPFDIYSIDNEKYIFFVSRNKYTELTVLKLKNINFDLSKLDTKADNILLQGSMIRTNDSLYFF